MPIITQLLLSMVMSSTYSARYKLYFTNCKSTTLNHILWNMLICPMGLYLKFVTWSYLYNLSNLNIALHSTYPYWLVQFASIINISRRLKALSRRAVILSISNIDVKLNWTCYTYFSPLYNCTQVWLFFCILKIHIFLTDSS